MALHMILSFANHIPMARPERLARMCAKIAGQPYVQAAEGQEVSLPLEFQGRFLPSHALHTIHKSNDHKLVLRFEDDTSTDQEWYLKIEDTFQPDTVRHECASALDVAIATRLIQVFGGTLSVQEAGEAGYMSFAGPAEQLLDVSLAQARFKQTLHAATEAFEAFLLQEPTLTVDELEHAMAQYEPSARDHRLLEHLRVVERRAQLLDVAATGSTAPKPRF